MLRPVLQATVSPASIAVFLVFGAVVVLVHGRLARSIGLSRWPTLAAGIAWAAGVAVTATPTTGPYWNQFAQFGYACSLSWPDSLGLLSLPALDESSLNTLVFLPFGVCSGLAVRRRRHVVPVILAILATPAVVEASQGITLFTRHCSTQDWLNNALGGLIGFLVTLFAVRAVVASSRRKTTRSQRE